MYELYLAHHGILGQRWGVRRFQNKDGSLTNAGEKRYSGQARHKPSSARKQAKQRAAALEKARKAKSEKKAFEEAKQKALTSGNATDVLKFQGHLTNKELQDAYIRINNERLLKDISAKETAKGKSKVDAVLEWVTKNKMRIETAGKIVKSVKDYLEAADKKEKEIANNARKQEKANALRSAVAKGWMSPEAFSKFINNEYVGVKEAESYFKVLEETHKKKE